MIRRLRDRARALPGEGSLTAQASWLLVARTLSFVVGIGVPLAVVRVLDPYHFGLYRQSFLVIGTFQSLLPLGVGLSAFYFLPRFPDRANQVITHVLLYLVCTGVAFFVLLALWPGFLRAVFNDDALTRYALFIGVNVALFVAADFLEIITVARGHVRLSALFTVGGQVTRSAALLLAAIFLRSVPALLFASCFSGLLQCLLLLFYLRASSQGPMFGFDRRLFLAQLAYALPFGVAGLVYRLEMDIHYYVVARRFEPALYAIYAVGTFQVPLIGILRDSVNSVLMPRVNALQHASEHAEIWRLIVSASRKLALAHFPLYGYLIVMGREFLVLFFTPKYESAWPVFALNLTLILFGIAATTDPVLRAHRGQSRFLLQLRCISLLLLAGGLWIALDRYGIVGAIGVVVLVASFETAAIAWRTVLLLRPTRAEWRLGLPLLWIGAAAAAGAAGAAGLRWLFSGLPPFYLLLITAAGFAIIYLLALTLLRVPTVEEKQAALELLRRLDRFSRRS